MTPNNLPNVKTGFPTMTNALRPLLLGLVAAVALTGCPAEVPPPPAIPAAPEIEAFTASRQSVKSGDSVTLTWQTKNAENVQIESLGLGLVSGVSGASGTVDVAVNESTVFVLSAKNARGVRESATVAVSVEEGSREALFAATPKTVSAGEPVTLTWVADRAKAVSLRVKGGELLDIGSQLTAGAVKVNPTANTVWELTVDGAVFEASVEVRPTILLVSSEPSFARPGEALTVQWLTLGATRVTVEAVGRGQVHETTMAGQAAEGSFTETVAETVGEADVVSYIVRAHGANDTVTEHTLSLYVGGQPEVELFTAPELANVGMTFPITWKTKGADYVELTVNGVPFYRSQTAAEAAQGQLTLDTPDQASTYRLSAVYVRGGTALSDAKLVKPIGPPQVVGFTASPTGGIQDGGDPLTLNWNVANARNLRIEIVGGKKLHEDSGDTAGQGTLTHFPNKQTTYRLFADNGAGIAIQPVDLVASVASPATLTFSPAQVPAGGITTITSVTAPGVTVVKGLPAVLNLPGTAFENIVGNGGTSLNYNGPDTTAVLVTLPETFSIPLFGGTASGNKISISINGWFGFNATAVTGPDSATALPSGTLLPFAFLPLMDDLRDVNGEIYWRLDTVNGVRRLIVQWDNVQIDLATVQQPNTSLTFQAQLYEDGRVVYAYHTINGVTTQRPSIGVQDGTMTRAVNAPFVPKAGDTLSFFQDVAPPVDIVSGTTPFTVTVESPTFELEIEASATIPAREFAISEVNYNPAAGQQQWFEVRNDSATPRDLQGWTIDFGGGNTHLIAQSLVLPANGFLVFGQTLSATEGGTVHYAWGPGITVPTTAGSISLWYAGAPYNRVAWTAAGTAGVAQQFDQSPGLTAAGGVIGAGLVCPATAAYGASGQLGTPGAAHPRCFPYVMQPAAPNGFQSILSTGTHLASINDHDTFQAVTLPRAVNLFGQPRTQLWVSSEGFASFVSISASHWSNPATMNNSAPNGVLAPFWDDLLPGAGQVRWQQFDPDAAPASGDEYTLISWENWRVGSGGELNFQIRINEGSGTIEYHYGSMTSNDTGGLLARGSSAFTGMKNQTGSAGILYNVNSVSPGIQPNTGLRFVYLP